MKLNQMRAFIAIAERGSVRAAARYLDIAQPAITRTIRDLEKDLGATLFIRQSSGVSLTPMGELFLRRARAIESEIQRARDEISQTQGAAGGHLKVCLSSGSHVALLPDVVRPFRQRYAEVQLSVSEGLFSSAEVELKEGVLDCYVGPLSEERLSGDIRVEKLFDNERVVMGRKGHPLGTATTLADLAEAEWIGTPVTVRAAAELGPLFEQHGLPKPHITVHAGSTLSIITLVAHSDLLTMLPIQWTRSAMTRNLLERIGVREVLPAAPIYIASKAALPLTPAAEYFCDLIRRAAGHAAPEDAGATSE